MDFQIVKMYRDKAVKKNVKNILLSICDVKVFLTFIFTQYDTVLTTILPYFTMYMFIEVPVKFFNAYFSDAQKGT